MTVEVERKFVCDAEIMWKLQDIGAKCIGQRQFRDQYFDSPDFILTLKDFWLRCREGLWELKCPAVSGTTPDNDTETVCTRYREITSLPLIQSEVSRIIREHTAEGSESNSSQREQIDKVAENEDTEICSADDTKWLNDLNLVCFAEFKTERCSYTLEREAGAVRVDLDQADFGYCVGEIEVLVPEGGDMNAALQRITGTAVELGLSCEKKVKGKMDVYLQRYRPEHYAKLLSAHIL
ncbi:thiamine-triphosphatase-like isoform X2 [Sinocyclocheilus anshuiensis]|uniref:thiamine-triphosphatase-like isoform X2 n=1 Tax=Sinocyclocheilus anshuiensis TaxID=1608454 RepID=UPI0007BAB238|nr:PREDICTED: thiamine-triphosphatase-like isoform X2 [Sinocyclocheilus anshuiensis]